MIYISILAIFIVSQFTNWPLLGKLIFDAVCVIGVIDLLMYEYGSIGSIIFSIKEWFEDLKEFFKLK